MNRDNNRDNRNDRRDERNQRPGRGPSPTQMPGFEGQLTPPPFMPQGPGPGMEGPRTAPPNFIPQPTEMDRRSMEGPTGFGYQYGQDRRRGQRDLRRCVNRFTFIWLVNGNSFWFYPTFVDRQFVQGFRWRRNRWEFDRININRIIYFRCF